MEFADRLKIARKESHLTQKQVADFIGISEGAYCSYEKAKREPNIEKIRLLSQLFDVSADFLINNNKYNKNPILNDNEKKLLEIYNSFNEKGKEKLLETADDMYASKKYESTEQRNNLQTQKQA